MPKRIMRAFKIHEISAVDQPAQSGAVAVLMKRADNSLEDEKLLSKGSVLTSNNEGHSHLIYCLEESGGTTSHSKMPGEDEDFGHSHPYVITDEGKIVIGEAEGHTHIAEVFGKEAPKKKEIGKEFGPGDYAFTPDIDKTSTWKWRLTDSPGGKADAQLVNAAIKAIEKGLSSIPADDQSHVIARVHKAWIDANPSLTTEDVPPIFKLNHQKENDMDPKEIEALKKSHSNELAAKDAALVKANKLAELNDVEKSHYNGLDEEGKTEFLTKSVADRKAILAKADEANPVVYKSAAGIEYRKSAGEATIALAKQNDELAKGLKIEREARENAELEKRSAEEFKNLPGTSAEKAALLKSLESIPDEATRKAAIAAVKAGDSAMTGAFTRKGAGGGSSDSSSASDQLDVMAKKYAEDNKVAYSKAYTEVLKTAEGKALYEKTV